MNNICYDECSIICKQSNKIYKFPEYHKLHKYLFDKLKSEHFKEEAENGIIIYYFNLSNEFISNLNDCEDILEPLMLTQNDLLYYNLEDIRHIWEVENFEYLQFKDTFLNNVHSNSNYVYKCYILSLDYIV